MESDDIKKLPTDSSEVPKSHLEFLDILMKDNVKMGSLMDTLKDPLFASFLFLVMTSDAGDSLIKKFTGHGPYSFLYKTIIFFVAMILFKIKK